MDLIEQEVKLNLREVRILSNYAFPNCKNCAYNLGGLEVDCVNKNTKFSFNDFKNNRTFEDKIFTCFEHREVVEKLSIEKNKECDLIQIIKMGKVIAKKTNKELINLENFDNGVVYWLSDFKNL